jgi:arabinogalactan oligomer/maltooligosaccharide transport system permease protein
MSVRKPKLPVIVAVHALLAIGTMAVLYPVMLVVKKAFEPGRQFALSPSPIPKRVTLDHFRALLSARGSHGELAFLQHTISSLAVAIATTVVGIALSCTAAYALSRFRFPGRKAALTSFLVVQMFPASLLMIPLYVLLHELGLLNSLSGLVLVYSTTAIPFCVWTLKGYFDSLPRELFEAARVDGAGPIRIFWTIVLPLARPGIAVTALFSFMTAWNEFILASTFLTDEGKYTLPVMLKSSVGQFSADWGQFAAGALLTSLPVMALFYVVQKYLVGGLTAGAVKG